MAKATPDKTKNDIRKAIEPDKSLMRYSIVALVGSSFSILIAALALYIFVIQGSNQQLTDTVFQSHAEGYAEHFAQRFELLQSQLETISKLADISQGVESHNSLQNDQVALDELAANAARYLPHIRTLQVLPLGSGKLEATAAQLSFPEADMINRAEKSQDVLPEVHPYQDDQALRMVQSIRSIKTGDVVGVLFARFSVDSLSSDLELIDAASGAVQLEQVFSNKVQTVLTRGGNFLADKPSVEALVGEHWRVKFQPSESLAQENSLSPITFWLPMLLALTAVVIFILYAYLRLRNVVREDAINLVDYCRSLIVNEEMKQPTFGLSLFTAMAKTLYYTEEPAVDSQTAKATSPAEAPKPVKEEIEHKEPEAEGLEELTSMLDDDLDIDEDEILDLDLVENAEAVTSAEGAEPAPAGPDLDKPLEFNAPQIEPSIFRAYDIRGIVGKTLDTDTAYLVGMAVGSEALAQGGKQVAVGCDGRLSSPELSAALIQGLRDSGSDVVNVGMVPTPVLYFATHELNTGSGVMITGSHNPADYNGFKIMIDGKTLANEDIQGLYQRISNNEFSQGNGAYEEVAILPQYAERIANDLAIARPLKVVVDCGNGVAGVIAPQLLEEIGCEVIPLYCEVDGQFPNHHPDPGKPENLQDLIAAIGEHQADLGLAFDGDGDRVGVVTNQGEIIFPDRLMMLFAKDIVSRNPGADIIFDVKCSRRLAHVISQYGGRPIMWKTGHSLIKAKMKETGALLAGEMSGHIFFKERWYGFDDGVYSAARLLELLSLDANDASTLFQGFEDDLSTPEINIEVGEEQKFDIVSQLQAQAESEFLGAEVNTIDGLRVDFDNGWGLVRASNTTPMLVLRFAADDEPGLADIQSRFKALLSAVAPEIATPF